MVVVTDAAGGMEEGAAPPPPPGGDRAVGELGVVIHGNGGLSVLFTNPGVGDKTIMIDIGELLDHTKENKHDILEHILRLKKKLRGFDILIL